MRTKRRYVVWAAVAIVLVSIGAWGGSKVFRLWPHLQSLRATLPRLEAQAKPETLSKLDPDAFGALSADFATLSTDLEAIDREMALFLPLTRYLGWLPGYGEDIRAAPALLDVANGTVRAGHLTLEALQPVVVAWKEPAEQESGSLLERLLPALQAAGAQLAEAETELALVSQARAAIDASALSDRVGGLVARLDRYLPLLQLGVQGAQIAPGLLGAQEPRTYLVIAQNNHELRATGGFISGVGLLRLDGGRIAELSFSDSYAVDDLDKPHPPPPPALQKYMKADILLLRDANWSPDFPTAAQVMASIYALDQGVVVDGVIGADLTAVQWMVQALGPLRVEGFEQPVNGKNVMDFMMLAWGAPEDAPALAGAAQRDRSQWREWLKHRKDFMGSLLQAMQIKLESGRNVDLGRVLTAVMRCLDEKHVLVHVDDAEMAGLLSSAGWTGALQPGDQDFLMVVDTNMGYNKVNPRIEQEIDYEVLLSEGERPQAELTLRYRHTAEVRLEECIHEPYYGESYDDMMNRCYWDYVRVYAPAGSDLRETRGFEAGSVESSAGELGAQVFAGFFVMMPGEERVVTLRYDLPPEVVEDGVYRLRVQKQPGTHALPFTVLVRGESAQTFDLALSTDQVIELPQTD